MIISLQPVSSALSRNLQSSSSHFPTEVANTRLHEVKTRLNEVNIQLNEINTRLHGEGLSVKGLDRKDLNKEYRDRLIEQTKLPICTHTGTPYPWCSQEDIYDFQRFDLKRKHDFQNLATVLHQPMVFLDFDPWLPPVSDALDRLYYA